MKIKVKTVKANTTVSKDVVDFADEAGAKYDKMQRKIKADQKLVHEIGDSIKKKAASFGIQEGTNRTIKGKRFVVGYQERQSVSADTQIASKVLPKEIYDRLMVRMLDIALFEKLVEDGTISRSIAAKILKYGKKTKYLFVKELKK